MLNLPINDNMSVSQSADDENTKQKACMYTFFSGLISEEVRITLPDEPTPIIVV
jgi:hypothetical protein